MSEITITEADVYSFREKLDEWAATLTVGEQAILAILAARAFPDESEPEVAGFGGKDHIEIMGWSFGTGQIGSSSTSGGAGAGRFSQVAFGGGTIDSLVGNRVSYGGP